MAVVPDVLLLGGARVSQVKVEVERMLTPPLLLALFPVSVAAVATQADLTPDGGRGGQGRVLVQVDFTEDSLSYMDRLLVKMHHRWEKGRVQVPEGGGQSSAGPLQPSTTTL